MIEIEAPDGSVVEFPDGTPDTVIERAMQETYGGAQAAPEKSVGGFVQNIGTDAYNTGAAIAGGLYAGGRKLLTDPVGAAGDVYKAGDTFGAAISGGLGHLYNAAVPSAIEMTPGPDMKLASKIGAYAKDRYWDNLGDTLYEHPVQSAMDLSTLAYGGAGLAAKAPMLSKTLGTVAEVTNPLNVVAKPVQALRGRSAMKEMRKNAPSYETVVAEKNTLYNALDNAGIQFDAKAYYNMVGRASHKLRTFTDKSAPLTRDALSTAQAKVKRGSQSFRDIEDLLSTAKGILREPNASNADKAAAHVLIDELDGFFNKAPLTSNGTIAAENVPVVAAKAREMARRSIVAREALEIERKSKWYTSGDESGVRNQAATYGKRNEKSLTPMEAKELKKVARREGVHGLLNTGGSKLTQTMLLGGLGMSGVGIPALAAGAGLSMGSRALSAAMTNAKMKKYLQTVLAGREAQAKAAAKAKAPVNTKGALIGAQTGRALSPEYVGDGTIDAWQRLLLERP